MSLILFRTEPQLSSWLRSSQRAEVCRRCGRSDEGFLGIRPDHPVRYHRPQRGRETEDDAELEVGDAPIDGALPHGDADVEIRDTGGRGVGRRAVAVGVAHPGGQRGIDAVVVDANGVIMVPPLVGPG